MEKSVIHQVCHQCRFLNDVAGCYFLEKKAAMRPVLQCTSTKGRRKFQSNTVIPSSILHPNQNQARPTTLSTEGAQKLKRAAIPSPPRDLHDRMPSPSNQPTTSRFLQVNRSLHFTGASSSCSPSSLTNRQHLCRGPSRRHGRCDCFIVRRRPNSSC